MKRKGVTNGGSDDSDHDDHSSDGADTSVDKQEECLTQQ